MKANIKLRALGSYFERASSDRNPSRVGEENERYKFAIWGDLRVDLG